MANAAAAKGEEGVAKRESALARGVPDMLKDGNYSEPPTLFRHSSMEKIRHCCQNLNLLPYLLYSVDNSKSHPIARKVNLRLAQVVQGLTERISLLYSGVRRVALRGIRGGDEPTDAVDASTGLAKTAPTFRAIEREKPKQNPVFLIMAVYFAPLIVIFQLVGLCSLMFFGKYRPGFVFLVAALMFLACVKLTILLHSAGRSEAECCQSKKRKKKLQ